MHRTAAHALQLLINLLGEGLLLDEMSPRQRHEPSTHRASWMGLCRPPGGPHVRRIDIKVTKWWLACQWRGNLQL